MSDDIEVKTEAPKKTRGLGRGLNALFEDEEAVSYTPAPDGGTSVSASDGGAPKPYTMLDIDMLKPGGFQPRQTFDVETLIKLSESIREHGILQPLVVRPLAEKGRYEIIAGERRWRAAQDARLHQVPVIIKKLTNKQALEIALVENLQREDLNPIDEAQGYQRLMEEFGHTQEDAAKVVGKSRSHIANTIRLLNLPAQVQRYVLDGKLSSGHARALITAKDPASLAKEVIGKGLSVRETERLAALDSGREQKPRSPSGGKKAPKEKDADTVALEQEISNSLGMKVTIDSPDNKSGSVKVAFSDLDQLDEIIKRLSGSANPSRLSG